MAGSKLIPDSTVNTGRTQECLDSCHDLPATGPRRTLMGRRPRRGWHLSSALLAVPVAALSFFRAVPWPWPAAVVQLVAFTPWLVFPAAAALLLALPGRRPWLVLPAAGLLVLQLLWLFPPDRLAEPAGEQRRGPGDAPAAAELTVMSLNTRLGQADAAAIVRLVRDNGVGLLALQEFSPALEQRLDAEGLGALLPHRITHPQPGAGGGGVYAAGVLVPLDAVTGTVFGMRTLNLSVDADGLTVPLAVTNVHMQAPVEGQAALWRSDLAAVGTVGARSGNVLLLGDFNATFDHAEFRGVLDGGRNAAAGSGSLVDAGVAAWARFTPTWPMDGQLLPGVVIDHIVTSRHVRGSGYAVRAVPGTDHAAVLARLSVPAGG